jgi:hypothetical protein
MHVNTVARQAFASIVEGELDVGKGLPPALVTIDLGLGNWGEIPDYRRARNRERFHCHAS